VRGSWPSAEPFEAAGVLPAVETPAEVFVSGAGVDEGGGAGVVGVVVGAVFVFGCEFANGSWYWLSPALSASAAAGAARASTAASAASLRERAIAAVSSRKNPGHPAGLDWPTMHGRSLWPRATRIALVHDFLLDLRGAERVFLEMCSIWPEADVYTAVYDEEGTEGRFADRGVRTSFLQRLRPTARTFRALLPLYPAAIESFDFSCYDLVISSSSAWSHAIICDEQTTHISYCHNPFRYVWNDREHTLAERRDPLSRAPPRRLFPSGGQWDWIAPPRRAPNNADTRGSQGRSRRARAPAPSATGARLPGRSAPRSAHRGSGCAHPRAAP
jgi:hypothetical protein